MKFQTHQVNVEKCLQNSADRGGHLKRYQIDSLCQKTSALKDGHNVKAFNNGWRLPISMLLLISVLSYCIRKDWVFTTVAMAGKFEAIVCTMIRQKGAMGRRRPTLEQVDL